MRLLAVVGVLFVVAALVAGCGASSDGSSDRPAAASDASVQQAVDAAPAAERGTVNKSAAKVAAAAGQPPPGADHSRERAGSGGVLQGTYTRLNGERDDLAAYRGKVVLVVNTATQCGFTPQFEGLEALYRARRSQGLVVLGFPANDFAQETRSDKDIAEFCRANYGVTFPMFSKTVVTGGDANPLFRRLNAAAGEPEWNFNKYLVDRRGKVVARFGAGTEPDAAELTGRLEKLL